MHLIGTPNGVYKVGTLRRRPDGEQWSRDMIKSIVGSPQQPQPGSGTRRITTFAKRKTDEDASRTEAKFEKPTIVIPEPRNVRITKSDVEEFGPTPGCAGCRAIAGGKSWRAAHSAECRVRMEEAMRNTEAGKQKLERVHEKMTHIVDNAVSAEEERGNTAMAQEEPAQEEPAAPSATAPPATAPSEWKRHQLKPLRSARKKRQQKFGEDLG